MINYFIRIIRIITAIISPILGCILFFYIFHYMAKITAENSFPLAIATYLLVSGAVEQNTINSNLWRSILKLIALVVFYGAVIYILWSKTKP